MSVQEQREQMIEKLTRIESTVGHNSEKLKSINENVAIQNGRVRKNEIAISKIIGIGGAIVGVLSIVVLILEIVGKL